MRCAWWQPGSSRTPLGFAPEETPPSQLGHDTIFGFHLTFLPTYSLTFIPTYLPTYLPTNLPTNGFTRNRYCMLNGKTGGGGGNP